MAASTQESHVQRSSVVVVVPDDVALRAALLAGSDDGLGSPRLDPGDRLVLDVFAAAARENGVSVALVIGESVVVPDSSNAPV
jgi:hypothetical protein